jgi:dephospho-CoA kinase
MAPEQARARLAAQVSREQRLAIADVVIDNSGSLDDLDRRVADVWAGLQRRLRALPTRRPGLVRPARNVRPPA